MKRTKEETTAWVEARLEGLGLSAAEFCRQNGVAESQLSLYKNQKVSPRSDQIEKLAEAFEVDPLHLMIALGLIDPDGNSVARIVTGHNSIKKVWKQ